MAETDMDNGYATQQSWLSLIGLFISLWLVTETPIENKLSKNEYITV